MKREAFKMFLKPGFEKEYEKRHAAIWPELKKMLSDGGVYDYSIYWDKDTNILFACQKTKGEESSQDMGANPIVQKWWDYIATPPWRCTSRHSSGQLIPRGSANGSLIP